MEERYNPLDELATFINSLSKGLENTQRAEERTVYRDHFAAAALIFAALRNEDHALAKNLVAGERRSFGWGFLSGDTGSAAEAAFANLAQAIDGW